MCALERIDWSGLNSRPSLGNFLLFGSLNFNPTLSKQGSAFEDREDIVVSKGIWKGSEFELRSVRSQSSLERVGALRFSVYVNEMGRNESHADVNTETLVEPLDRRSLVIGVFLKETNECVGTARLTIGNSKTLPEPEFFQYGNFVKKDQKIGLVTKLIVRSDFRRSTICSTLVNSLYKAAREEGISHAFIDSNDHLVSFYKRLGFIPYGDRQSHGIYGEVTRMAIEIDDYEHLEAVRSPFAPLFLESNNKLKTAS